MTFPAAERAPRVSAIVPCYNAAEFVEDAVARLLAQQAIALEVIVVDDGSADETAALASALAAQHPEVTFVALPENQGVAAAREAAVAAATAEYVWFVDADDEWPSDAAATLLAAAETWEADIVCAAATVVAPGRDDKPVGSLPEGPSSSGPEAFRHLLTGRLTGHLWNKLFRRTLLERIDFTRIRQHSDQAMVAQALSQAGVVAYTHREVYRYLLRSGSIIRSGSQRADSLRSVGLVVARCMARIDATELRSTEYLYYRARYSVLARLKDATSGAYPDGRRRDLVKEARGEMSLGQWGALLRRRDATRLTLYTLGWASPPLYARTLDRFGGRL